MELGLIGLGRMGAHMARRWLQADLTVVGYARHVSAVQAHLKEGAITAGATSLADLAKQLSNPRIIWMMVPAASVDATLESLIPLLASGDVVIDGRNSHYHDDIRRAAMLTPHGIHYLDVGTSGAVWPIMKRQGGGKILNFSRAGGSHNSKPQMLAYNCAKAGIDALTVTFAREGKPWGISVNALGPGVIVTQANLDAMHPTPEEVREQWVNLEQLIEAALFLVTPAGDGVNGVMLPVQGKGI